MFTLPIGDTFDTFVRGLKENLSGFFESVSNLLDFAITVLERTLSLDPSGLYPSVLFGIALAVVSGRLAARRMSRRSAVVLGIVIAVTFTGAEVWRISSLQATLDPEQAGSMAAQSSDLRDRIVAEAPDSIEPVQTILSRTRAAIPASEDRESAAFKAARAVERAERSLRRAGPEDYDTLYDALDDTLSMVTDPNIDLPSSIVEDLASAHQQYAAFSLVGELEDLSEDYAEVSQSEPLIGFLNQRTHERITDQLVAARAAFGSKLDPALASVENDLRRLDPNKLQAYGPILTTVLLVMIAALIAGRGIAIFSGIGFLLILSMNLWDPMIQTLALVLSATLFALLIGIPLGILAARSRVADQIIRPILDFMQTMPAFVYLIPAVIFFGLGAVPGAMATLIFAMPPAVRLTSLGIRQVPEEVVEAAESFGATDTQLLVKAQIPIALPTILAGVNQTIMLALSMVVIGGMIGAGGLGEVVLSGITKMDLGLGFEGGLAVVVLAIFLDRVTQKLGPAS